MDVDTGITRKLPPPVENPDEDVDVNQRNVLKILLNSRNDLMVDGKRMDISLLKDKTKDFMAIHPDNPDYPEVTTRFIDELGKDVPASKGVVSLKNDRGTSYEMYIQVQNELARAFNEMKDEKSIELFGLKYTALLDKHKIKAVNQIVPVRVSEAEPEDIGGN